MAAPVSLVSLFLSVQFSLDASLGLCDFSFEDFSLNTRRLAVIPDRIVARRHEKLTLKFCHERLLRHLTMNEARGDRIEARYVDVDVKEKTFDFDATNRITHRELASRNSLISDYEFRDGDRGST